MLALVCAILVPQAACTSTPPTGTANPSATTVHSVTSTTTVPSPWDQLASGQCGGGPPPAVDLPRPPEAFEALDRCRLLVVDQGKVDLIHDGQRATVAAFSGVKDVNQLVWADDAIWLAGTADDGRPVVQRLQRDVAATIALPAAVSAIDGLVAEQHGILAAVGTANGHGALIRITRDATTRIAEFGAEPSRIAGNAKTVVVSTTAPNGVDVLVGPPTALRVTHLGPAVDVRAVVVTGDAVLVGLNALSHGVPTATTIMTSTDTGRTWSRHNLQGAELADLATSARTTFVSMTWPGHDGQVFRSTDTTHWTAVPLTTPGETLPSLSPTTDGVWVIGRSAFPIAS